MAPDERSLCRLTARDWRITRDEVSLRAYARATRAYSGTGACGIRSGRSAFSPDGQWIGFTDGQTLKKVPLAGGLTVTIADVGPAAIASWTTEGIVFADMRGLFRVSAEGGTPEALVTNLGAYEQALFPQLLPKRRAILFTIVPTRTNTPGAAATAPGARIEALDLATGERRTLVRGGGRAQYVPTGHLIYAAGETLYAVAFDIDRLEVQGEPVAVVTQASREFALSEEGTLIYRSGTTTHSAPCARMGRSGGARRSARDACAAVRLSALVARWDARRDRRRRTPGSGYLDVGPAPSDARAVYGRSGGESPAGVEPRWQEARVRERSFRRLKLVLASCGRHRRDQERLLESDRIQMPFSFAPDGRLLFPADVAGQGRDVHALSMDGSHRVERILYGTANEGNTEVSPDGRWMAYDSDESGQFEVYVRPYPDAYAGGRWQISSGGGKQALWSRDGREIFYRDFGGALLAASVTLTPTFTPGPRSSSSSRTRITSAAGPR